MAQLWRRNHYFTEQFEPPNLAIMWLYKKWNTKINHFVKWYNRNPGDLCYDRRWMVFPAIIGLNRMLLTVDALGVSSLLLFSCILCKNQSKREMMKSQITSTKSQTNSKFQYSMTKTVLIGSFFDILSLFGILDFGHCDLFGIWYLYFGISDLSGLG